MQLLVKETNVPNGRQWTKIFFTQDMDLIDLPLASSRLRYVLCCLEMAQ